MKLAPMDEMNSPPHMYLMRDGKGSIESIERQLYGISLQDIYNYCSYAPHIYAAAARRSSSPYAPEFLRHLINVYDLKTNDSLRNEDYDEVNVWNDLKKQQLAEAKVFFADHYEDVIRNNSFSVDEVTVKRQLDDLNQLDLSNLRWDRGLQNVIGDPITVDPVDRERHYTQRKWCGYSDFDMENPAAYLHWITIRTLMFLTSPEAAGRPADFSSEEEYREFGQRINKQLYLSGFTADPNSEGDFKELYARIPDLLLDLWD